ncbi:MAG: hypothetical protein KME22_21025 [Hassallia sp. WJT32-NPBG1]|jgi:hypothetical protein|nr:hypothetical protein [Hassallia sp. WJT32-NPBG1]
MLLSKQKLFFKANSLSTKEIKSSSVVEQITKNYLNSSTDNYKKTRLSAKWEMGNGNLVCNWLID